MTKIFEDEFMEYQEDMVAIAKEYVENRAEKIYLYGSIEGGRYNFNLFYKINNQIVTLDNVNLGLKNNEKKYDISSERQWKVLRIGTKDLQKIKKICDKYERPVPTQFKLIYDVQSNSLKAKYQYDFVYSDSDEIYPSDIFMSWYDEIKKEVEG